MDRSLFRFILRHSKRQQVVLLVAILFTYPINLLQYELPKQIIDRAIGGSGPPFSATFFGVTFSTDAQQVAFLVMPAPRCDPRISSAFSKDRTTAPSAKPGASYVRWAAS